MMKKRFFVFIAICLGLASLTGCQVQADEYGKYSMVFFDTFDTRVQIIGYAKDEAVFSRVTAEAQKMFEHLHKVYDGYNAYEGVNNLYALNQNATNGTAQVEPELMDLLLYCKDIQPTADGKVNVAMGSVLSLWHEFREEAEYAPESVEPPSREALEAAAQHIDFDTVLLDPEAGTVTFTDPAVRIDLGAIAKGYATELVAQWMLESEMPSFIISAGGNVRAGDPPKDKLRWGVGIQDPDGFAFSDANSDTMETLFLNNVSVVTSGDYQRFITIDGVRYHHIISPDTLMPADFIRSVTIVCEDSAYADFLSTAVFLMPYEEGRAYVDALEGVEAYWVLMDRSIEMTDGMRQMAKSEGATSK